MMLAVTQALVLSQWKTSNFHLYAWHESLYKVSNSMKLIYEFTSTQVARVQQLFEGQWWTKHRTIEETQQGIDGSQICIGVVDTEHKIQGFCRIVTDFTFKALIFDLIISDQYRGAGLGSELLFAIEQHPKLTRVKHFELYCLPELVPFYEKHGFTLEVGGINLMRRINLFEN